MSLSLLIYCTFSFALIGWNEVFPVWAKTSPHLGNYLRCHVLISTHIILSMREYILFSYVEAMMCLSTNIVSVLKYVTCSYT